MHTLVTNCTYILVVWYFSGLAFFNSVISPNCNVKKASVSFPLTISLLASTKYTMLHFKILSAEESKQNAITIK